MASRRKPRSAPTDLLSSSRTPETISRSAFTSPGEATTTRSIRACSDIGVTLLSLSFGLSGKNTREQFAIHIAATKDDCDAPSGHAAAFLEQARQRCRAGALGGVVGI